MPHIFSWPTDCRQTDRSHYWIYVEQPMIIPSQMPQMKENDVHGVMIRLTASFLRELVHSLSHFANKLGPVVLDNWGVLFWSYSPFRAESFKWGAGRAHYPHLENSIENTETECRKLKCLHVSEGKTCIELEPI